MNLGDDGNIAAPTGSGALARNSGANGSPAGGSTDIARMRQSTGMAPTVLELRRMIHANRTDPQANNLFRELRTCLLQTSGLNNPVILVTGVRTHCGVSHVARNLAIAIAMEEDRSALLIDCNLERASQDAAFDLVNRLGLSDYLSGSDLPVEGIIHATGIPRLRVIPAGSPTRRNRDQLGSLRMRALLESLRQRYDDRCLVLDAPPACGSPDARLLAQRANLVVLVAGEAQHSAEQILMAAQVFDPAKFAGVVFNEMP